MESLLHYVWKHQLFEYTPQKTTDGIDIEIIDTGNYNSHAGPDFFNAKIKTGNQVWAGNVEIHTHSSDWYKHAHEQDKSYNSVILHVVEHVDVPEVRDSSGRIIPQIQLQVPQKIRDNYLYLLNSDYSIPCAARLQEVGTIYLTDWRNALLSERLERKTNAVLECLDVYRNDWNEVFYLSLARNFGFGINSDAFERLAKSLPLKYIAKHSDSALQVEALFLGQAGLLTAHSGDEYYRQLRKEYLFLQNKYRLQALDSYIFKSLRIRPNNFPHIKIVQLAAIVRNNHALFSRIIELSDFKDLAPFFVCELPDYWLTHYHFEKESVRKPKSLGTAAIHLLVINTIVPILFSYAKKNGLQQYADRAIRFLESIPSERNYIISLFQQAGVACENAADSQSLIQLKKEYCDNKKCIFCRIGYQLLTQTT